MSNQFSNHLKAFSVQRDLLVAEEGKERPVTRITYPPFIRDIEREIIEMLEKHGCRVDVLGNDYTVVFPQGTVSREIFPRTQCERHRIKLPDGFLLMSEYDPFRDIHLLFVIEGKEGNK
jgi:hypothetical protein